jgi:hypothetical protein
METCTQEEVTNANETKVSIEKNKINETQNEQNDCKSNGITQNRMEMDPGGSNTNESPKIHQDSSTQDITTQNKPPGNKTTESHTAVTDIVQKIGRKILFKK